MPLSGAITACWYRRHLGGLWSSAAPGVMPAPPPGHSQRSPQVTTGSLLVTGAVVTHIHLESRQILSVTT